MTRVALTFIGKDRPGIIAGVSRTLFENGANIEDTTMTILEGQFAMILLAVIPPPPSEQKVRRGLAVLKRRWGLNCFWERLPKNLVRGEKHPPGTESYVISVIGKDRTGIVFETSRILAEKRLNITDLNSKILGKGKQSVFAMVLEVDVPKGFRMKRLEPAWTRLRRRLKVDISVKPLERLSL